VHGFDYTALHWADKQKPLREVAGEFGVFPEAIGSPPLVPETIDEETTLPVAEVSLVEDAPLIERITVTEHFLVVERVPARQIERRAKPREPKVEREMEAA
jgi:hypothetical protein